MPASVCKELVQSCLRASSTGTCCTPGQGGEQRWRARGTSAVVCASLHCRRPNPDGRRLRHAGLLGRRARLMRSMQLDRLRTSPYASSVPRQEQLRGPSGRGMRQRRRSRTLKCEPGMATGLLWTSFSTTSRTSRAAREVDSKDVQQCNFLLA